MIKAVFTSLIVISIAGSFSFAKRKPKLPEEFVYLPSGTFGVGDEENMKRVSIPGFYFSRYEVTNKLYRDFLTDIFPRVSKEEYDSVQVDSTGWKKLPLTYQEPMQAPYFRHPAYNNFPVVNITFEAARKYCTWLQQKIQADNPDFDILVHLPTQYEWIYGASNGRSFSFYPWGTRQLDDDKGNFLCNFKYIDQADIRLNPATDKPELYHDIRWRRNGGDYTMNVNSFAPNKFKLYNMSGNVAEMVMEKGICMGGSWNDFGGDVTVNSASTYEKSLPTVGFRPAIQVKERKKK
jgi:formylglycine-generating enzyme required for sulfatase activity